jgi:hypothetical protein
MCENDLHVSQPNKHTSTRYEIIYPSARARTRIRVGDAINFAYGFPPLQVCATKIHLSFKRKLLSLSRESGIEWTYCVSAYWGNSCFFLFENWERCHARRDECRRRFLICKLRRLAKATLLSWWSAAQIERVCERMGQGEAAKIASVVIFMQMN